MPDGTNLQDLPPNSQAPSGESSNNTKMDKMLSEFDKNLCLMINERNWNKILSIASLSSFIALIILFQ
jgi:hypothetical protein